MSAVLLGVALLRGWGGARMLKSSTILLSVRAKQRGRFVCNAEHDMTSGMICEQRGVCAVLSVSLRSRG